MQKDIVAFLVYITLYNRQIFKLGIKVYSCNKKLIWSDNSNGIQKLCCNTCTLLLTAMAAADTGKRLKQIS